MAFLFSGLISGCSTPKSNQNAMIEPGTEHKIQEIVVSGILPSV
jgi:hypothetical protein